MNNYSVILTESKDNILLKDGIQTCCPIIQPLKVQGQMGQVQIIRVPCSSSCPHSHHDLENKTWRITCGGAPVVFDNVEVVTPDVPEKPKPQTKLVSL